MKNRRTFIKNSLGLAAGLAVAQTGYGSSVFANLDAVAFQFKHEPLPYAYRALEPAIDAQTMQIHHERHYAAYVKTANEAIQAENVQSANEKDLFKAIDTYSAKLRNNAGGAYNHAFFWKTLRAPQKDNRPTGSLAAAIDKEFGSFAQFQEAFSKAATQQFGSGWAWLVLDAGKLKVGGTPNQDNPLMKGVALQGQPLLGLDVWEHAYYLKYQNKRPDYVAGFWSIVNWPQVQKHFDAK